MIDSNKESSSVNLQDAQNNDDMNDKCVESVNNVNSSLDSEESQINQLKLELLQLQEHERDTVLRLQAEIENIRRRSVKELEKVHKFSLERFVFDLLPVIDNLERTLSIADTSNVLLSAIVEGIELTLKSFLDTVYKFGVESIHETGIPFNPDIHQAISMVVSEDCSSNQVLTIIQKGYMLHGRLIRPAMVTVSQAKCE